MATAAQRAAYFYPATRAQKAAGARGIYELHVLTNGRREILATRPLSNKLEARVQADIDAATPWNF